MVASKIKNERSAGGCTSLVGNPRAESQINSSGLESSREERKPNDTSLGSCLPKESFWDKPTSRKYGLSKSGAELQRSMLMPP
jgi:hypothetical protein